MISSAEQLIRENMRTQAPSLDLGNCGLDGSEDCLKLLKDCGHLRELNFSNRWEEWSEVEGDWLHHKSSNNGNPNVLNQIPVDLPVFLCMLRLARHWSDSKLWQINQLTGVAHLVNLQKLDLSYNQITSLQGMPNL